MFSVAQIALWFATSKTGRIIAAVGGALLAIGVALLKAFNDGRQAERAKQDQQSLDNLRSRTESDAEINTLNRDDLIRRARRWGVHDDEPR